MSKKEHFRKVLEKCVSNFIFSEGINIKKSIEKSHYQMRYYFAKNDEERDTVEILFSIINEVAKQYDLTEKNYSVKQITCILRGLDIHYKLDLKSYSDQQLLDVVSLIKRENNNGEYTNDIGILWYGGWQLDELNKLYKEIKESRMTPNEKLVEMLLNGSILDRLNEDFPGIRLQDKKEYVGYINEYWRKYPGYTFALYRNYKLEIVCTGILAAESVYNAACRNLKLNSHVGFRMINRNTGNILKIVTYSDIKRVLSAKSK